MKQLFLLIVFVSLFTLTSCSSTMYQCFDGSYVENVIDCTSPVEKSADINNKNVDIPRDASSNIEKDCFPFCDDNIDEKIVEKTFTISGVDKIQEISSEQPVKLIISGVRNEITIFDDTEVTSIIVSGIDITITLPRGANPDIIDSGLRTSIVYY